MIRRLHRIPSAVFCSEEGHLVVCPRIPEIGTREEMEAGIQSLAYPGSQNLEFVAEADSGVVAVGGRYAPEIKSFYYSLKFSYFIFP